ncbi:unnamed protein product [Prorocentrum cordatum]|uniref:Uncharacterized protein n=1 Tax=Prorocentrum cordatum TaxID=2364126 RepID=A0ABN9UW40_9DINO|nr:unnamed protein product [Polarella glacialis]
MILLTVAPLLWAANLLADALAVQADPEEGATLRPRPPARDEDDMSLGFTSQSGPETWEEDAPDVPIGADSTVGGEAEVSMPLSRLRDSDEGATLRRGLGLQVGSFVRHLGAPTPRQPAAAGPDGWPEGVASQSEQSEGGGAVVSIRLSRAVGDGLGLGPQLGARAQKEGAPGREHDEASGEAEVSMPMSERDAVGPGRALAPGPGTSARVSLEGRLESVPLWYADVLEAASEHHGHFFRLVFLVNVLLASAFYCQPSRGRRGRSKLPTTL